MDSRPVVHASCDITSKEEKKIPVCHGSQSWSLLAGAYETLWFGIREAQSSLARWAGWISGKDGGWVQVKKKRHYFFCLTWRLLIVSSRVALSSKVVRRGAEVLQKHLFFFSRCISNLLFPTHKQLKIYTTTTHNQVYQPLPGCGFASDKDRQLSNLEPLIKMDEKVYECGWMYLGE